MRKGNRVEVTWLDLELPVVLVKASRKRSVDLFAQLEDGSSLIVELKFAKRESAPVAGNAADYAIMEVLTY
jgi:hypothetical protein